MSSSMIRPKRGNRSPWHVNHSPETGQPDRISSASNSVTGGRTHNEDRCYRCDVCGLYLVADGMGGHTGGALASQIAIETIPARWQQVMASASFCYSAIQAAYGDAVTTASREMSAIARQHPEYRRMGCTLALGIVLGGRLYYGNVGDCRVYQLHRNKLSRLSKDETLVQGLVDAGDLSVAEARKHRWRHIVTNSVAAQGIQISPRLRSAPISHGDLVLITSDGLTDELADYEIEHILTQSSDPQQCVDQLIAAALARDAQDNVSCLVFQT